MGSKINLEDKWWYRLFKVILYLVAFGWILFSIFIGAAVGSTVWPEEDYVHVATCYDPVANEYTYPEEVQYKKLTLEERVDQTWEGRPCNDGEFWSDYQLEEVEAEGSYITSIVVGVASGVAAIVFGLSALWLIRWVVLYVVYGKDR